MEVVLVTAVDRSQRCGADWMFVWVACMLGG